MTDSVRDRPNATTLIGSADWAHDGTSATFHAAVNDSSDATYVTSNGPGTFTDVTALRFGMPNTVPPGQILGIQLSFRANASTGGTYTVYVAAWLDPSHMLGQTFTVTGPPGTQTYAGFIRTTRPDGQPWTQADLDAMEIEVAVNGYPNLFVTEVWRDIYYASGPTISVTVDDPSGVTRPTVNWSYSTGGPQDRYEVKVFSAAQQAAPGFDPAVSSASFDSGLVHSASARSFALTADLTTSTTYKAYVKVWQPDVGGSQVASAWTASADFTVSAPPPLAPGLTAHQDNANARIALDYVKNNPDVTTLLYVQYSDDAGVTWVNHPGLQAVPITGSGTVYDYESPARLVRRYRAKVVAGGSGSAWSGTTSAYVQTDRFCIKSVLTPSYNVVCDDDVTFLDMTFDYADPQSVDLPAGPGGVASYIVTSEGIRPPVGSLKFRTVDQVGYDKLIAVTQRGDTLLLQDVHGGQWYVRLGTPHQWRRLRGSDPSQVFPVRMLYEVDIPYTSVQRP